MTDEALIVCGPRHAELIGKHDVDDLKARSELLALGLTPEQFRTQTGAGLRNVYGCFNTDTVLAKYAAGALSAYGVMGAVFGSDSPQHHRGHNLGQTGV